MKKVLALTLVFFIISSMMMLSMAVTLEEETSKDNENLIVPVYSKEDFFVPYHVGYTLLKNGRLKKFSDKNRVISEKIPVDDNYIYYFKNLSAKYGNCLYVVYNSDNEAIDYLKTTENSKGYVLEEMRLIMSPDASYIRIACDLGVNNKMFEASKAPTSLRGENAEPAIISFSDDDCKKEVWTELHAVIDKLKLPYTLACPPKSLEDETKYMTEGQVCAAHNSGDDIISHHLKEYAMTEFKTIEEYEQDTITCLEKLENMRIEPAGVAYPNGRINDDYMSVVQKYFDYGLTIDRGINVLPYESYYIDRCEVFQRSGIYNVEDAMDLVDSVAKDGGWLVLMTHCWFDRFSSGDIENLVAEIIKNDIEILSVTDAYEKYSNPIEIGCIKKPFTDMSEDFFVLDCMGRVYTNNPKMVEIEAKNTTIVEKSPVEWVELSFDYSTQNTLRPSGKEKNRYEELKAEKRELPIEDKIFYSKRNVSLFIDVIPNNQYKLQNLSAKYDNCFYVIYDSNNGVIDFKQTSEYSEKGETLDETIVTMPSNAAYLKVACDLDVNDKLFKVFHAISDEKSVQ